MLKATAFHEGLPAPANRSGRKIPPQVSFHFMAWQFGYLVPIVSLQAEELAGLSATVDDVIYMPSLQAPEDRPHPFVYFITISNQSSETITIRGRKWIISQELTNEKTVVEGEGVVNQTPRLTPGEDFSYNSYHVVPRNSQATGGVLCHDDEGRVVYTKIPNSQCTCLNGLRVGPNLR